MMHGREWQLRVLRGFGCRASDLFRISPFGFLRRRPVAAWNARTNSAALRSFCTRRGFQASSFSMAFASVRSRVCQPSLNQAHISASSVCAAGRLPVARYRRLKLTAHCAVRVTLPVGDGQCQACVKTRFGVAAAHVGAVVEQLTAKAIDLGFPESFARGRDDGEGVADDDKAFLATTATAEGLGQE